jgi:hypothetical protein
MFSKSNTDRIPQIDAMRVGVDYYFNIKIKEFSLRVRPLSIVEQMQVAATVVQKFQALPVNHQNRLSENMLKAKETLIIASTSDVGSNDPQITEYILDRMTDTELSFMWKQYMEACDRVNPELEKMSVEEIEKIVLDLKKKERQLIELSFMELINLCRHLIKEE